MSPGPMIRASTCMARSRRDKNRASNDCATDRFLAWHTQESWRNCFIVLTPRTAWTETSEYPGNTAKGMTDNPATCSENEMHTESYTYLVVSNYTKAGEAWQTEQSKEYRLIIPRAFKRKHVSSLTTPSIRNSNSSYNENTTSPMLINMITMAWNYRRLTLSVDIFMPIIK